MQCTFSTAASNSSPVNSGRRSLQVGDHGESISLIAGDQISSLKNLRTRKDLTQYLQICSGQEPIMEGHACKDISKPKPFDKFRRRYFILYRGVLLYYNYKSQYEVDKSKGLVSYMCSLDVLERARLLLCIGMTIP